MTEELVEIKGTFPGFQNIGYPGAFPPKVEHLIKGLISSPCLHLFSGTSLIGNVRVDLSRKEATNREDVFNFIEYDKRKWQYVILDIPYEHQGHRGNLKREYASNFDIGGSVELRTKLVRFLQTYCYNVLWFDQRSPVFQGFKRHKTWLFLPGAWQTVRVLTWLKREGLFLEEMQLD